MELYTTTGTNSFPNREELSIVVAPRYLASATTIPAISDITYVSSAMSCLQQEHEVYSTRMTVSLAAPHVLQPHNCWLVAKHWGTQT
jgi:hypothetical protein